MTLPEIRNRLHELADLHGIPELHELAHATRRRITGRRASSQQSAPVTPELALAVAAYTTAFPDKPFHEVGPMFGLNPGRVSEILNGKRT